MSYYSEQHRYFDREIDMAEELIEQEERERQEDRQQDFIDE